MWAGTKRNIHPLAPTVVIDHPSSASSIYYNPWHPPCSIYVPDTLFAQSLSKFSLVYLLAWYRKKTRSKPQNKACIDKPKDNICISQNKQMLETTARFCRLAHDPTRKWIRSYSAKAHMWLMLPRKRTNAQADYSNTHTHTQLFYCSSGTCPGPPGWAGTRKVKTRKVKPICIYWSKRQWVAVASTGLYASLHLIPDNHANIPPLSFLQAGCPSWRPTNSIETLKDYSKNLHNLPAC